MVASIRICVNCPKHTTNVASIFMYALPCYMECEVVSDKRAKNLNEVLEHWHSGELFINRESTIAKFPEGANKKFSPPSDFPMLKEHEHWNKTLGTAI